MSAFLSGTADLSWAFTRYSESHYRLLVPVQDETLPFTILVSVHKERSRSKGAHQSLWSDLCWRSLRKLPTRQLFPPRWKELVFPPRPPGGVREHACLGDARCRGEGWGWGGSLASLGFVKLPPTSFPDSQCRGERASVCLPEWGGEKRGKGDSISKCTSRRKMISVAHGATEGEVMTASSHFRNSSQSCP